jgi:hypothetical protein
LLVVFGLEQIFHGSTGELGERLVCRRKHRERTRALEGIDKAGRLDGGDERTERTRGNSGLDVSAAFAAEKDSASATAPAVKDFIAFIEHLRQRGWILYRYLSHNGRGAPLDHRCSRIKFEAASTARSGALYRAPTLTLIGSYFGEITGNGKNARVRR